MASFKWRWAAPPFDVIATPQERRARGRPNRPFWMRDTPAQNAHKDQTYNKQINWLHDHYSLLQSRFSFIPTWGLLSSNNSACMGYLCHFYYYYYMLFSCVLFTLLLCMLSIPPLFCSAQFRLKLSLYKTDWLVWWLLYFLLASCWVDQAPISFHSIWFSESSSFLSKIHWIQLKALWTGRMYKLQWMAIFQSIENWKSVGTSHPNWRRREAG